MDYGAITLDTSIFKQKRLFLESGILKTLEQFKCIPSRLILPEIIKREVQAHLATEISKARAQVYKALSDNIKHLTQNEKSIEQAKHLLIPSKKDDEFAESRLESFIDNTGAEIIQATGLVEWDEVIERYFHAKPPFSNSVKKKYEFPDAIALISLESWARNNSTKVLAVSNDGDWEAFAKDSEYIDVIKDLAQAIAVFQPLKAAIDYCRVLAADLPLAKPDQICAAIEHFLSDLVPEMNAHADAISPFIWESDTIEIDYQRFEFEVDENNKALVQPVQSEENHILIEAKVTVYATASCLFDFSVRDSIDKDYVKIGDASVSTELEFEAEILFSLDGDYVNSPDNVNVEIMEYSTYPITIDFGDIEPDYDDNRYHL
jgi:PIN domain